MSSQTIALQIDRNLLNNCYADYVQLARSIEPIDAAGAEAAVTTLYKELKKPKPMVIVCDSPWQLMVIPVVLQLLSVTPKPFSVLNWMEQHLNDGRWMALWRTLRKHRAAIAKIFEDSSRARPSLFTSSVTGANIECDVSHLFYRSIDDIECDDYTAEQHQEIREATKTRVFNATWHLKAPLTGHCYAWLQSHLPKQFLGALNRHLRSQCHEMSDVCPTGRFPQLRSRAAQRALNIGVAAQLKVTQISELESWVKAQCDLQIQSQAENVFWTAGWGNFYMAQLEYYVRSGWRREGSHRLAPWQALSNAAPAYLFYENIALVCDRPRILQIDEDERLHNENGAALCFSDGYMLFAWHGRTVPQRVIVAPETLTVPEIESERNVEIRQIMVDRFGVDRFLHESGAACIDRSKYGVLWRRDALPGEDEEMAYVEVVNSTAEPDGTFKHYFLRVPPDLRTARAAAAWTFGFDEDDYAPLRET